jgi:dCTP deaminase
MDSKGGSPLLFSNEGAINSSLSDKEISELVKTGYLITPTTFSDKCLCASSYDIRVGLKGVVGGEGIEIDLNTNVLELQPGAYGGIISFEKLLLPKNIFARIGTKRALSYDGIVLLTGSIVDPGYEGHLLFGLYNATQKKVIIRLGRKICNIVFERLFVPSDRPVALEPNLKNGQFPDDFLDKMANMDVLPWMQISERVKQIENITKDIIDLKARYEDVLQPIKDLTKNVETLAKDIGSLTQQTKTISEELNKANEMITENGKHIGQLTQSLVILSERSTSLKENLEGLKLDSSKQMEIISTVKTDFGRFKLIGYIFWAIVLLIAGALASKLLDRLL